MRYRRLLVKIPLVVIFVTHKTHVIRELATVNMINFMYFMENSIELNSLFNMYHSLHVDDVLTETEEMPLNASG